MEKCSYLGLIPDRCLKRMKRTDLWRRYKLLLLILYSRSNFSLSHKLRFYKHVRKPAWRYGLEDLGTAYRLYTRENTQKNYRCSLLSLLLYYPQWSKWHVCLWPFPLPPATFPQIPPNYPNSVVKLITSKILTDNPVRCLNRQWPRDHLT